jgi:type IV pilus assembly protein PilQ
MFFFHCVPGAALAAARRDIPPGLAITRPVHPVIASIQVTQMGDNTLKVRLRGFEMPLPRAASAPGAARLTLQWDGARFPESVDANDWWNGYDWDVITLGGKESDSWWKQYELPLLNRIIAEPVDEDSVRLTFVTTQPVVVDRIDGIAGADDISVMLRIFEPEKAPEPAPIPKQYQKGDPMGIKAPVTLQLRDAEIKSVFRMLADLQKLNLLLDPSVPDMTVTFSFSGVPYNEAFAYLLRMADLSYSVTNGMLVVGRPESLGRTLGTEYTKSYKLSYAIDDAGSLRGDLTGTLTGLVSLSKAPTLDPRTRELYITATEEQHAEINEILKKLDHPGRQVMLEARIFSVKDGAEQELEALVTTIYNQWLAVFSSNHGLRAGYNAVNPGGIELEDSFTIPMGGGTLGGTSTIKDLYLDAGIKLLSAGLSALEKKDMGKNIANPRVITIDGQEANVSITANYRYVSGSDANGNPSYGQVTTGPQMTFLPVIGRDDVITIKINISTGEITRYPSGYNVPPETADQSVTTTVRVRDGEPFVVGGLFQDIKSAGRSRMPVLGYIPLLGNLFTYRKENHERSEIAMIDIPHILDVPNTDIPTSELKKSSMAR